MHTSRKLRLGTRSSLLALAQSRLIARALQAARPGLDIEVVTQETRGDRDLQTPLTEVNDPDFFSAELDQALLNEQIDLCVHSYKDLSLPRPDGLEIAALPSRANPADVVLFRSDIETRLRQGAVIRIGSSSQRRQNNTYDFLSWALPRQDQAPQLEFCPLRGSVTERVQRLNPECGSQQLDGVVLALAGLERLWTDPAGRQAIAATLSQARWMVLPLSECPTAAGQGALAIECRSDDRQTLELLQVIHDPETAQYLQIEQELLSDLTRNGQINVAAELCGATCVAHPELGYVARLRGRDTNTAHAIVRRCKTATEPGKPAEARPWTGLAVKRQRVALNTELPKAGALFIAHWHALEHATVNSAVRCWTSGVGSWRKLAQQGIWIEGCTDHLGFGTLQTWLDCEVLQLPELSAWSAITHQDAVFGWRDSGVGSVLATYSHADDPVDVSQVTAEQLAATTHFYWLSPQQFRSLRHLVPENAHHACGPGKTVAALRAAGVQNIATFPSQQEWQRWLA